MRFKSTLYKKEKGLMKKIFTLLLLTFPILYSCKDDTPTNSTGNPPTSTSGSFNGEWTIDKVQIVQAPTGSSISAIMKQALVSYGEINGSSVGELNIKFGSELMNDVNTNLGIQYVLGMKFFGSIGYALGYSGSSNVLKQSLNSGVSWSDITLPYSYLGPNNVYVYNSTTLYQVYNVSGATVISKSTNAGANWFVVTSNIGFNLDNGGMNNDIFVNDAVGYGVSINGIIYKTTNGGLNWFTLYDLGSPNSSAPRSARFFSEQNGFVISGNKFYKTTTGGTSWDEHIISSNIYTNSGTFFLNENIGWIIVTERASPDFIDRNYVYKTNNGGSTWTNISRIESGGIRSTIRFTNENDGYLASQYFIFKTTNSGSNWDLYCNPENTYYQNVEIINNEPCFFSRIGIMSKPSGVIDTMKWVAQGKLTNSAIMIIANTYDRTYLANGSSSRNSNSINFSCSNYSGGGPRFGAGGGTFSFDSEILSVLLDLPNNEKWKIQLRRR